MVSEFQGNPTVNKSGIIVLLGQFWVYVRKRVGFGRGRRENEFRKKKKCRDVFVIVKTDLICLYL